MEEGDKPDAVIDDDLLWLASCLAHESVRTDRLLADPYASHLAGPRGARVFAERSAKEHGLAAVLTVAVVDELLQKTILEQRVHTVVDLSAGLDTRPFRLRLPNDLRWIELDGDALLLYKSFRLAHIVSACRVERVSIDVRDAAQRAAVLRRASRGVTRGLLLTENLLGRVDPDVLTDIAPALPRGIKSWILGMPGWAPGAHGLIEAICAAGWEVTDRRPLGDEGRRLLPARHEWGQAQPERDPGDVWLLSRLPAA